MEQQLAGDTSFLYLWYEWIAEKQWVCVFLCFFVVCVCIIESSLMLIHASLPFCQSVFGTGAGLTLSNGCFFFPRVPFLSLPFLLFLVWSGARFFFSPLGFQLSPVTRVNDVTLVLSQSNKLLFRCNSCKSMTWIHQVYDVTFLISGLNVVCFLI